MTKPAIASQYPRVTELARRPGSGLEAFDAIYAREFDYVWRTCGRLGVPISDLADAVHDVFVVLHQRWDDVDISRPIRPWLFGVARRVAASARRKRAPTVAEIDVAAPAVDPLRDVLWRGLATLDDDRRAVVILHDLEGHTGADIAAMLDLSVNTVHSRLRLGRADLVAAVRRLRGSR